ncbi:MAG: GDP-mannose 4,6-dehydratase [Nitrospirota bacterium]
MMKNALLIGGTGFVGHHLERCLQDRYRVTASGQNEDIRDTAKIKKLILAVSPDIVINLAAITTVQESFERQNDNYNIGFFGTLNLLTALKAAGFHGRMLQVGSSEVYGFPSEDQLPLSESEPLRPMSPYAVNKVAIEALCYQWSQTENIEIVTTRSFTHIGPGQSDRFAISSFARQIAEIKVKNLEPVIHVGDLSATRDFTDVRDVVNAYDLLVHKGRSGDIYNVCSNEEVSTQWMLEKLINISGIAVKVLQDTKRFRKAEQRRVCGSNTKLIKATGWQRRVPLELSLSDILTFWENKVGHSKIEYGHI